MFTMPEGKRHAERKRFLARGYAKSGILRGSVADMIEERVQWFIELIETRRAAESGCTGEVELGGPLHFFTLDISSAFIYGPDLGTTALRGQRDRALLGDFEHPLRRPLSWAAVHGVPNRLVGLSLKAWEVLTRQHGRPTPFTALRKYGLEVFQKFEQRTSDKKSEYTPSYTLLSTLWAHHGTSLTSLSIASECVDHLLAGIETTRNTLLFLIWTLSLPEHRPVQEKLRKELSTAATQSANGGTSSLSVETCDSLPYLNAVVKEALRLYAPLPALQPRSFETDVQIDEVLIPAGTTVSISPYTLHRDPDVFPEPLNFAPERWVADVRGEANEDPPHRTVASANKSYWPFSSGARMCTGSHLAMAEMTTLVATVYRQFQTEIPEDFRDVSPAITSRFENFWDEKFVRYEEGRCPIAFRRLSEIEE